MWSTVTALCQAPLLETRPLGSGSIHCIQRLVTHRVISKSKGSDWSDAHCYETNQPECQGLEGDQGFCNGQ